jgi:hypothetical protein
MSLRKFAVVLLNDDQGINYPAWELLRAMLRKEGHTDIIDAVDMQDGRVYLPADKADDF